MSFFIPYSLTLLASLALVLILTPRIRTLAIRFGLVDKPNARKVHLNPVPLVGGIVVFTASLAAYLLFSFPPENSNVLKVIAGGAAILLLMGILDDKKDLKAVYKLVLQIALAYWVFHSGIRIDTLFGIFNIHHLHPSLQYILTLLVIAGVVNAFNLTDGIDGLAAGLAIVGFAAFTYIAFLLGQTSLALVFLSLTGALLGFLRFNLSARNKIFMGDAGSLFLGFVLVVSGLYLIQSAKGSSHITLTLSTVIGILALPVIDSLRVYRRRLKTGYSPFRADKTHFHHLVLQLGLKHKPASALIILTAMGILILSVWSGWYFSLTVSIIIMLLLFTALTSLLGLNGDVNNWKAKVKELEQS